MIWNLDIHILNRSKRLIAENQKYLKTVAEENYRRMRRSKGTPQLLPARSPESWGKADGFNPYIVRQRYRRIAHAVSVQLSEHTYSPQTPVHFKVPKDSGGFRTVTTFQIADEVISNQVFLSLMRKNRARFSAHSYAYRFDRGPHDAILDISRAFANEHRLFVAEYDFKKFFNSVDHSFLLDSLDRIGVARTQVEQRVIEEFLKATSSEETSHQGRGIPQGTSLSLFLANLAATELDRSLEHLGVGFARYADDTVIWSKDYGRTCEAACLLQEASLNIGSPINYSKSPGISLLISDTVESAEMISTNHINYLGHTLSFKTTSMKTSVVSKIKKKVTQLIYHNLLLEPLNGTQDPSRLRSIDKDYIVLISQLRRYLYGPLSESDIRRFSKGEIRPMSFAGLMSYFPLVDDERQLKDLDKWIAARIWLAMKKRARLLSAKNLPAPSPHGLTLNALRELQGQSVEDNRKIDLRIPSIWMVSRAIKSAVSAHGLGVASGGIQLYLYSDVSD